MTRSALRPAGSTRAWRRLRSFVLARDAYSCRVPITDAPGAPLCGAIATHVDHITPRVAGGTDDPANLRAACARCNLRRGASALDVAASVRRRASPWRW